MFRLLVIVVFFAALTFGAASSIPLSFAMRLSGLAERGLSWQQARGTVWNGQVAGLSSSGVDLGSARIRLRVTQTLLGNPPLKFELSGRSFQARFVASASRRTLNVADLALNSDLAALPGLNADLRRTGGTLSLRNASLSTGMDGTCTAASGAATLDSVQRLGLQYGRDWPLLSGTVSCNSGTILLQLAGEGAASEAFDVAIRLLQTGATQIRIRAANLDPEAAQLLPVLGFKNTTEGLVFYQDTSLPK